jgi:hypothetical protein
LANGAVTVAKMSSNSCTNGQILKFDGTAWACAADSDSDTLGSAIDSSEITDGVIVNADINASAAIDYSKLNLGTNITSTNITNGTIVDADINSSAAIDANKINYTGKSIGALSSVTIDGPIYSQGGSMSGDLDLTSGNLRNSGGDIEINAWGTITLNDNTEVSGTLHITDQLTSLSSRSQSYSVLTGATLVGGLYNDVSTGIHIYNNQGSKVVNIDDFMKLKKLSSEPLTCDSSAEGSVYYNSTDHKLKVCNATAWIDLH